MEKEQKKENKHDHHEHHKPEASETVKKSFKMPNMWMIATALLVIALVVVLATRTPSSSTGMSAAQCGQQTVEYLNSYLVQPGTQATLESVNEESGVYAVITDYLNRSITVYTTKDCSLLFLSSLNTTQEIPSSGEQEQQETEVTKTDKPIVELYVMSFCPYGVQAENAMKPVADLLGTTADIKVRFITNVGGTNISDVSSLHGLEEAKEDVRQLCIMKYYPSKYWSYLMDINENCYPKYRDAAAMDLCWKNASAKLGIDAANIETCAYGSEGIALISADESLTEQYGISGSPTLLINGVKYSGSRTPEAFKAAICSAFTTAPSACSQTLSEDGGTTSGNC